MIGLSNIVFGIMRESLQSDPFPMSQNFETQGCQWYGVKRIKSSFANKRNMEQGLGHLFITFN